MLQLLLVVILVLVLLSFFGVYSGYVPVPLRLWRRRYRPHHFGHFDCVAVSVSARGQGRGGRNFGDSFRSCRKSRPTVFQFYSGKPGSSIPRRALLMGGFAGAVSCAFPHVANAATALVL